MSKDLGYDQIPIAGLDQLRQLGSCSKAVPQVERIIAGKSDKSGRFSIHIVANGDIKHRY